MHHDDEMAAAYETQFGTELDRSQQGAMRAWVKAFAANGPLLTDSDDAISDAVGAPGQKAPFFGLLSSAKFRDNADKGYKLGLCKELGPWPGWTYVKLGLIAKGTDSPNAAKLFIHFVLTEEGIAPQVVDGKLPTNPDIGLPPTSPRASRRPRQARAVRRLDGARRLGHAPGLAGSLAGQLREMKTDGGVFPPPVRQDRET